MNKKTSEKDNTVIMSDKYISESGVQGGKIIGEHIALGSFIIGIQNSNRGNLPDKYLWLRER